VSASRTGGSARFERAPASAAPQRKKTPAKTKKAAAARPARSQKSARSSQGRKAAPKPGGAFEKISALCLALPGTKLTMTWGSPHFRVADKIFCGFGEEGGKQVMGVKLRLEHAREVVKKPGFWVAPYVGRHGWVSMDVAQRRNWEEVAELIRESYELIAPKALRTQLR